MKYQAILFDVDGTLLDTTEYIYGAFEHSLAQLFHPLPRNEIQKTIGKPLEECYRILTGWDDVKEISQIHHLFQVETPPPISPYPSTISTLQKLKDQGIRLGAVTSRARSTTYQNLTKTGTLAYIEYVVAVDDIEKPKPDPESLMKALAFFNVPPQEAIMVGDSPVDIEAGKNAGTLTIGAAYGFHGEKIAESQPDYVIGEIGEVEGIIAQLEEE